MADVYSNVIFEKIVQAMEQTIYIERNRITTASRLVDDLNLGKFGRIRLAMSLEETFDVEIPDEVVQRFGTVGDIAQYIDRWSLERADGSARAVANVRR